MKVIIVPYNPHEVVLYGNQPSFVNPLFLSVMNSTVYLGFNPPCSTTTNENNSNSYRIFLAAAAHVGIGTAGVAANLYFREYVPMGIDLL